MGTTTGCHKRVSGEDAAFHGLSAGHFPLIIADGVPRRPDVSAEYVNSRTRADPSLKAQLSHRFIVAQAYRHAPISRTDPMIAIRCYGVIMRTIF